MGKGRDQERGRLLGAVSVSRVKIVDDEPRLYFC
jgi:hypothetical protein